MNIAIKEPFLLKIQKKKVFVKDRNLKMDPPQSLSLCRMCIFEHILLHVSYQDLTHL